MNKRSLLAALTMVALLILPVISHAKKAKVLVWEGPKPRSADVVDAQLIVGLEEDPHGVYAEIRAGEVFTETGEYMNMNDPNIKWGDSSFERIEGMTLNPENGQIAYNGTYCGTYIEQKGKITDKKCSLEAVVRFKKIGEGIYAVDTQYIEVYLQVPKS